MPRMTHRLERSWQSFLWCPLILIGPSVVLLINFVIIIFILIIVVLIGALIVGIFIAALLGDGIRPLDCVRSYEVVRACLL